MIFMIIGLFFASLLVVHLMEVIVSGTESTSKNSTLKFEVRWSGPGKFNYNFNYKF
jgi:hypothetical protein